MDVLHSSQNKFSRQTQIIIYIVVPLIILVLLVFGVCGGFIGYRFACLHHEIKLLPSISMDNYDFQNGDLLLFSGAITNVNRCFDILHMLVANSPVTHVGIVVRDPKTHLLRVCELAFGGHVDSIVRLTNLPNSINSYKGTIMVRRIYPRELSLQQMSVFITQTLRQDWSYKTSFYLNSYDQYFVWHPPLPLDTTENYYKDKEMICTDLVEKTYQFLNVFTKEKRNNSLWPADFYKSTKLPLRKEYWFGPEIKIEPSPKNLWKISK